MNTITDIILALLVGIAAGWFARRYWEKRREARGEESETKELEGAVEPPKNAFMTRLSGVMDERMADPNLTVDDIVREMGMGRTVFFKRLKGMTGQSPVEFIRETRLRRAAELLRKSEASVTEVAHTVGITDSRYFAKCFKHTYGVTPTEFRGN